MKFETFKAGRWTPRYLCKSFEQMQANRKLVNAFFGSRFR